MRDAALHAQRNHKLRADFNRLKGEERPLKFKGETFWLKLTSDQAVKILSARYSLSCRQIENVLYATEPQAVPLKSAA